MTPNSFYDTMIVEKEITTNRKGENNMKMNINITINFDMDGTIADFYGVENWLDYLMEEDTHKERENELKRQ